jgi:tetratricopeptide (TPR) repeat protein
LISIILLGAFSIFFSVKTYTRCRTWHDATTFWTGVIDQNQTVQNAYYNRGNIFMNENKNQRAIADFSKAIELNPKNTEAYISLGTAFYYQNKYDEAIRNYTLAIEIKDDEAIAFYLRGWAQLSAGNKDAACEDVNQAEKLGYKPATDAIPQICN